LGTAGFYRPGQATVQTAALARTNLCPNARPSSISWETFAISRTGGDIQATTKVVDCRSLKSSPPCILETGILESGILETGILESGVLECPALLE
jgi:hypothetical protein